MQRISSRVQFSVLIILLWGISVAIVDLTRPLYYSPEELHYASIAWEMWVHHHFILPIEGGEPYAEKGPLLFWLIHLGWWLFGVSTIVLRLIPALFGLLILFLLRALAKQLWADKITIGTIAPFILLGSFFFVAKIPVVRFDVMITFFVLWAIYQMLMAIEVNKKHWLMFSVSVALGLLSKGPVLFLFILPAGIAAYWWAKPNYSWPSVYRWMAGALVFSLVLTGCWLAPAILQGGHQYAEALLLSRSIARAWNVSQGHVPVAYWRQNWGYYFPIFAMMLLPWLIWPPVWQAMYRFLKEVRQVSLDKRLLLLFIIIGCAGVFLTLVEEKAPRYILPALPFAAVFIAYILTRYITVIKPVNQWIIALAYIGAGTAYALIPLVPTHLPNKYPWITAVSPIWGIVIIIVGLMWVIWRENTPVKIIGGVAVSTLLFWGCYNLGVTRMQAHYEDWRPLAQQIANLQHSGIAVAYYGAGQHLEFYGRLEKPMINLRKNSLIAWIKANPRGWLVVRDYRLSPMQFRLLSVAQILQDKKYESYI